MLIVFLLVLSAVKANEPVDQDGLRKPRQLDLGLQDIRSAGEELLTTTKLPLNSKNDLINGYLPPVSPSSSSEVITAQSQQAFDFKSVNSVEKESELCKFPFDNEACNFKDSSASDSKIPKPSRDLVPPFKDVEQDLTFKSTNVFEQTNKKITTPTRAQKIFLSTTEKPVTKFFKHEPNRKFTKIKSTPLRSRVVGSKAEATNELRSYLPPQSEFSAAAQTNVAVVQPANRNNDHDSDHHHGHHHGDNFNICADAFHSFLCAPLKARKRITGALPTRLLGESSFINYQKTLASFDRETASSNGFKDEYLPPNSFSSNLIQSTYLPPFSTNKPTVTTFSLPTAGPFSSSKIIPESTNFNGNVYLPPVTDNRNFAPVKFASSNTEFSTTKFAVAPTLNTNPTVVPTTSPPATTYTTTYPTTYSTTTPTPITTPTPSPTTIFTTVSTTTTPTPVPTTIPITSPTTTAPPASSSTSAPSTFSKISSDIVSDSFFKNGPTAQSAFNSALPTIPVFSAVPLSENSYLPPSPSPQSSASFVSNSKSPFVVTSTSLPSYSPFASFPSSFGPLPSNSIVSSQKPKVLPTLPVFTSTSSFVTTPKPVIPISSFGFQPLNPKNSYLPPLPQLQSSPRPSSTTIKPYPSTFKPAGQPSSPDLAYLPPDNKVPAAAQIKPYSSTFKPAGQPSNPDLAYFPPNNKVPAAAQIKPHPSTLKPSGQPSNPDLAYLPPDNKVPAAAQIKPYPSTLKPAGQPSNPDLAYFPPNNKVPAAAQIKPYPSTLKPTGQPSNPDLAYLPPDNKVPAAAQISSSAVLAPQTNNPVHHGRDLCTDPFHSFLCTSAKPRKKITGELPSQFKPEGSNTDELRVKPEPSAQSENKIRPDQSLVGAPAQDNGYKYTKPVNLLPSNAVPPSAPSLTDYSYSKPDKTFSSSSQQDIRLPSVTSTRKPEPVYRTSEAKTVSGYQYPKPDKIFPLPGGQENTKVITTTSSPTTGYSYPRPQKPFPLPAEQIEVRQKPRQKTSTSSPSSTSSPVNVPLPTNQARGYQYPKPDQSFNLPDRTGYSYPKPEKRLELPGEGRSKSLLPQSSSDLNGLGNLGSADFIPVNKVEFKRAESSKLLTGLRRFGERMKKRERQSQLLKRQLH